jgi:hypothetical protein
MTSRDYYRSLLQLVTTTTVVTSHRIEFDEQDTHAAYLKGSLDLIDGSKLFFAQYVRIEGPGRDQISREKYRYHWQAPAGETRYRWDNARHHTELATFPDHVHIGADEEARQSGPTDLWRVMGLIEQAI